MFQRIVNNLKSKVFTLSLKTQLLLILLFLLAMSLSLLTVIYSRSEDQLIDKVTENIEHITKAIQISVEELTYRGDSTTRLKAYVDMLSKRGIKEISIIGDNSEIIASSNPKKVGRKEPVNVRMAIPDFTFSEFKSKEAMEKLCSRIVAGGFSRELNSQPNTLDWLNELLRAPDLFNFFVQKVDLSKLPKETKSFVEELKKSYEDSKSERDLVRLNRLILEEMYPDLVPKKVKLEERFHKRKDLFIVAKLGEGGRKEAQKLYNVIMPVAVKGKHLGYIHISMVLDDYALLQKRNHIKRVLITISVFVLGIILCVLLAEKYTRPIKEVAEASRSVIQGNLKKIEGPERKDEIGTLILSFNEMIEKMIERKRLEEKLKESEQLSIIGQLSSGIAHEIRNPLNFISLSVSHVKETISSKTNFDEKEEVVSLLDSVMREIQRVNGLINNFLLLGKRIKLTLERTEVKRIIDEALYLLKDKLKEGIEIKIEGENETLVCDREYMRLCLLNLILNAIEAIDGKGKILIKCGKEDSSKYISVSDTGQGIDKDALDKIFEPYFSTKKFGIGLGLTLTKRLVLEHGGVITVESEKNRGTTVKISLPDNEG